MSDCVRYPAPGCVVEYLEGNAVQIALVTEEAGGRLRLLLPNRRETRLNSSRLLPWLGPLYAADLGREDAVRLPDAARQGGGSPGHQCVVGLGVYIGHEIHRWISCQVLEK